jgi:hypothetical protein
VTRNTYSASHPKSAPERTELLVIEREDAADVPDRRTIRKLCGQDKFAAHRLDGTTQGRDMHVGALLDLGNLLLCDAKAAGHFGLCQLPGA